MHYEHTDKRLDEWLPEDTVRIVPTARSNGHSSPKPDDHASVSAAVPHSNGASTKKRKRSASMDATDGGGEGPDASVSRGVKMSEEEYDIEHHKQITAKRNFDKVMFGRWQIKTWCVVICS